MVNKGKKNASQWMFGLFFLIFYLLIFLLNRMYPIHSDDWMYSFVFNEDPVRFVSNIKDIFVSQYNHYLYWGGRNVVHFIDQLLLLIPALPREIINSLAFVTFILLIYKIANFGKKLSPYLFVFIGAILWLGLPTFPQTVVWITGSANYLWGTLIVLCFVYFYIDYVRTGKADNSILKRVLFFVGGIIAGWTNENLVIAELFILLMLLIAFRSCRLSIPGWAIWGFIGVCIGCLVMLAAPGNFIRSHDTHVALNLHNKPFADVMWFKARNIYLIYRYIPTICGLIITNLIFFLIYWISNRESRDIRVVFISILFFMAAHISALAMIASPIFPVRASFCVHAFMIVSIAVLYGNIRFTAKWANVVNILFLSVLSVWVGITYYYMYYNPLSYLRDRYNSREEYIQSQKKNGVKDIVLEEPPIILPGQFDFEDITSDDLSWRNRICADYYGVNSIKRIEK